MSKPVTLTYTPNESSPYIQQTGTTDLTAFTAFARTLPNPDARNCCQVVWLMAGLVSRKDDGEYVITPRGEDLLASAHLLPDDPTIEPVIAPCKGCNGTGEQALFVSTHVCDRCGGAKVEPSFAISLAYAAPTDELVRAAGWTLIDSHEKARSFIGKRVEVDAPASVNWPAHSYDRTVQKVQRVSRYALGFESGGDIDWIGRGNVRLRLVEPQP